VSSDKSLYGQLEAVGLLEYGQFIAGDFVRECLGLKMPELGTKKDFDEVALAELAAVDSVREVLLNNGKYIAGTKGGYRILLPSENREQIDRYLGHAQKKIGRARKLERTSPALTSGIPDQLRSRLAVAESHFAKRSRLPKAPTE